MHSPSQLVLLILALMKAGDLELLDDDSLLGQVCPSEHYTTARAAARLMGDIYDSYSYTESPAFLGQNAGKSSAYIAMVSRRQSASDEREQSRARLVESFRSMLDDDEVFALVAERYHQQLVQARAALVAATRT